MLPSEQALFDLGTPKPLPLVEEEFETPRKPEPDRTMQMRFEPPLAGATFSVDRVYRYTLWRRFKQSGKTLCFVGLNPSTADETEDDPTVRRCVNFAKRDGYAEMVMLNLFAFRATDPKVMRAAKDPGGPDRGENFSTIVNTIWCADKAVLAWGNHGGYRHAGRRMYDALVDAGLSSKLYCLKKTQHGHPWHPLYVSGDAPFVPFSYDKNAVVLTEEEF